MDNQADGMIFVSVDGDNLGREVGGAILSDDIQHLHQVSQSINHGQNLLMDWAENNGGQVISAGGDEGIFQVPESALDSLEDLRSQYQQTVGSTLTIGIGQKPSEAGKALLYGKLNGKDQINHFSADMEDFLMQAHEHAASGAGSEEEQKQDEAYLSDMYDHGSHQDDEMNSDDEMTSDDENHMDASGSTDDDYFDEESGDQQEDQYPLDDQDHQQDEEYQQEDDAHQDEEYDDGYSAHDSSEDGDISDAMDTVEEAGVQEGSEEENADMKDAMKDEMSAEPQPSLKQKLGEVLESFKTDKSQLEQMNAQDPELYSEVVQLLQQMIRVAKMLSSQATPEYDDAQNIEHQEDITGEEVGKQIP